MGFMPNAGRAAKTLSEYVRQLPADCGRCNRTTPLSITNFQLLLMDFRSWGEALGFTDGQMEEFIEQAQSDWYKKRS